MACGGHTGDIKSNLRRLQFELRHIKYQQEIDMNGMVMGQASAFLPLLNYIFLDHSSVLAMDINQMDVELNGKTDLRFVEGIYKVLRDLLNYKPPITKDQFFQLKFGESKVIMVTDIIHAVRTHRKYSSTRVDPSNSTRPRSAVKTVTRIAPAHSGIPLPKPYKPSGRF